MNVSPYAYVGNNPINRIDILGLTDQKPRGGGTSNASDGSLEFEEETSGTGAGDIMSLLAMFTSGPFTNGGGDLSSGNGNGSNGRRYGKTLAIIISNNAELNAATNSTRGQAMYGNSNWIVYAGTSLREIEENFHLLDVLPDFSLDGFLIFGHANGDRDDETGQIFEWGVLLDDNDLMNMASNSIVSAYLSLGETLGTDVDLFQSFLNKIMNGGTFITNACFSGGTIVSKDLIMGLDLLSGQRNIQFMLNTTKGIRNGTQINRPGYSFKMWNFYGNMTIDNINRYLFYQSGVYDYRGVNLDKYGIHINP